MDQSECSVLKWTADHIIKYGLRALDDYSCNKKAGSFLTPHTGCFVRCERQGPGDKNR